MERSSSSSSSSSSRRSQDYIDYIDYIDAPPLHCMRKSSQACLPCQWCCKAYTGLKGGNTSVGYADWQRNRSPAFLSGPNGGACITYCASGSRVDQEDGSSTNRCLPAGRRRRTGRSCLDAHCCLCSSRRISMQLVVCSAWCAMACTRQRQVTWHGKTTCMQPVVVPMLACHQSAIMSSHQQDLYDLTCRTALWHQGLNNSSGSNKCSAPSMLSQHACTPKLETDSSKNYISQNTTHAECPVTS